MFWWIFLILGWLLFLGWLYHFPSFYSFLKRKKLKHAVNSSVTTLPPVSVIVPARNEEEKIEKCLVSLLEVDYPAIEIIAVNDRSTDNTGRIMDDLSKKDSRLTVVHIKELPDNWIGKNHAMHVGARSAKGDFILFTDGDVIFKKNALALAMKYVLDKGLDHLCLFPETITETFWESALTNLFGFIYIMVIKPTIIFSESKKAYAGIGAFNLVKKSSYRKIEGHVPLRLDIIDDYKLGKHVKMSGLKQDILLAEDLVSLRWRNGVWDLVKGLEKNMFASLNYSIMKLFFVTILMCYGLFFPYVGMFVFHGLQIWGYVFAVLAMHALFGFYLHQVGVGFSTTFALPIVALIFLCSYWNSAIKTLYQGGVMWRGTFYSLHLLRKNQY